MLWLFLQSFMELLLAYNKVETAFSELQEENQRLKNEIIEVRNESSIVNDLKKENEQLSSMVRILQEDIAKILNLEVL
jgi:cell shape-determining protein MreC